MNKKHTIAPFSDAAKYDHHATQALKGGSQSQEQEQKAGTIFVPSAPMSVELRNPSTKLTSPIQRHFEGRGNWKAKNKKTACVASVM